MKRMIRAASSQDKKMNGPRANVWKVVEALGFNDPMFIDRMAKGFRLKWGGYDFVTIRAKELARETANSEFGVSSEYDLADDVRWGAYYDRVKQLTRELRSEALAKCEELCDEATSKTGINTWISKSGHLMVEY